MSLRLLSVEVFVVALHEEEAMMVRAADSLSMESESSSEASAELVVSGRALLTTGDAFRGTFPMWCFFFFGCRVGVSLVHPPAFFLPWLALFDAFTNTHSISHISLSVVEFFLSLVPVLLSCSSLC